MCVCLCVISMMIDQSNISRVFKTKRAIFAGEYDGEVGEYEGEVGEYDGEVGEYEGEVGEYDGKVAELRASRKRTSSSNSSFDISTFE